MAVRSFDCSDEDQLTEQTTPTPAATAGLAAITVVAFAANSVFCRLALGANAIDAASFTSIRLLSGAVTLWCVSALLRKKSRPGGSWVSAAFLFLYAASFSFAYMNLSAGTGALILMGSVQATMILGGLRSGERPHRNQWIGLVLAIAGLVILVLPGITAPSPGGSALMVLAGLSWGAYSLRGRGAVDPVTATTDNFIRAVPFTLIVSALLSSGIQWSSHGVLLAAISGSLTSGIGYVLWYAALRGLTATRAAFIQLSVPVIAATGGVLFLSEAITSRLLFAGLAVLGGVALAVMGGGRRMKR
jgi:drug/metabolite transporter (DMT)-like permease